MQSFMQIYNAIDERMWFAHGGYANFWETFALKKYGTDYNEIIQASSGASLKRSVTSVFAPCWRPLFSPDHNSPRCCAFSGQQLTAVQW